MQNSHESMVASVRGLWRDSGRSFWRHSVRLGVCIAVLFFGWTAIASADMITGTISGVVSEVTEEGASVNVPDSVAIGDEVLLQFSYDSATTPYGVNSAHASYGNLTMRAQIGELVWEVVTLGDELMSPIGITNNNAARGDLLEMISSTIIGGSIISGGANEITLSLRDDESPFSFLSSVALPCSLSEIDPTAVTKARGWIYYCGYSSDHGAISISYDAITLQLQEIPEPSSFNLALLGLTCIGFYWWGVEKRGKGW